MNKEEKRAGKRKGAGTRYIYAMLLGRRRSSRLALADILYGKISRHIVLQVRPSMHTSPIIPTLLFSSIQSLCTFALAVDFRLLNNLARAIEIVEITKYVTQSLFKKRERGCSRSEY